MGIAVTSLKDLQDHLTELGLVGGMDVVVHSKLMSFGQIPGGASDVYAALSGIVGAAGTIAVPTYRLESPADEVFDPRRMSACFPSLSGNCLKRCAAPARCIPTPRSGRKPLCLAPWTDAFRWGRARISMFWNAPVLRRYI